MKEFKHIVIPDDIYYLVLSYFDRIGISKKVCDMSKDEFLEAYDKAVAYNRERIFNNDEYFEILENNANRN